MGAFAYVFGLLTIASIIFDTYHKLAKQAMSAHLFSAFSSIMFAFAGASTFPTIQADMKDKTKFPKAVVVAMIILASIYLTMSATSWGLLGDRCRGVYSALIG